MCSKQNRRSKPKCVQHDFRKNVAKTLAKHISCECKCKFDGRKCNSNQKWNNDKCRCKCKNKKKHPICKKDYICNPTTCSFENGKY